MRGHMSEKVDVFAFGVVMLEIISGRPNYDDRLDEDTAYLLEWVRLLCDLDMQFLHSLFCVIWGNLPPNLYD